MKRGFVLVLVFALAVGVRAAPCDLLVVAATDDLLRPLLTQMRAPAIETHAAWTLWRGELAGKSVVLARSEGDPLNATAVTTLALRQHRPRLVVVFGAARAHDPELRPGDVVVSEKFAAFEGMIAPPKELGAGSDALLWRPRPYPLMTAGEAETPTVHFPADPAALALARTLAPTRGRNIVGVLGSSPQVNREADRIAWLRREWKTSTEDSESAHVAGVALLLGVPVIGLRVVDGTADEASALALKFIESSR